MDRRTENTVPRAAWSQHKRLTDRRTDGRTARHQISFADYVSSRAKNEPCIQGVKCIIPKMFQIVAYVITDLF